MKSFWPHRAKAKGFSIRNLALNYRLKISNSSESSDEILNQIIDDQNLKPIKMGGKEISVTKQSTKSSHWANRDFSEYKEAA